jgi:hypothetical protein
MVDGDNNAGHKNDGSTFVRTDAFTFYALASISFLEFTVDTYVDNLVPVFRDDPAVRDWLERVWLPEESEHGRLSRQYVERVWPEFDWVSAYHRFLESYAARCDHHLLRPSPALEALARCVTETETAMVYRCFAAYVSDPALRALLRRMSGDEVRHYAYFRKVFDRYDAIERNTLWRKAATIVRRSQLVRDEDLPLAFAPLNDAWRSSQPFQPIDYATFFSMVGRFLAHHFPFEEAWRMLFRPLRTGRWFDTLLIGVLTRLVRRQYPQGDPSPGTLPGAASNVGRL